MFDLKDFSFSENQIMFDFKGFFLKVIGYWKWIIACILLFLFIAYQINIRKEKIYALDSVIVVREETSPLLTSNTSLIFNWGGVSDKVQTISTTLRSRYHNEQVVEKLEYYIDYLEKQKYNYTDAYGRVPFYVEIDKNKPQLANHLIQVKLVNDSQYQVRIEFEEEQVQAIRYVDDSLKVFNVEKGVLTKTFKVGQQINLPFLSWKLNLHDNFYNYSNKEYYVRFQNFNAVVARYQSISVNSTSKTGGSILRLELQGTNKRRLVEYLNTTTEVLRKNQLDSKNQFAVNTIRFIDSTIARMQDENIKTSLAMKDFAKEKSVYELPEVGDVLLTSKLTQYDLEKDGILRKIRYYNSLENYLQKSSDFSQLPAPTVAGIEDVNVVSNVSALIDLSVRRSKTSYGIKNETEFEQLDSQMESIKLVLLQNIISARTSLDQELKEVNSKIGEVEQSIRKMPVEKQEHMEILRKFNLEQEILSDFFAKRNQAEILRVSNMSDVHFIDKAKDVGGGLIGPKTSINYVIAIFLGILIPVLLILLNVLLDNSIHNSEEVKRLSKVPIIGILPKKHKKHSNLTVYEYPKSSLAESFRGVRSSLQFLYKKQNLTGSKVLMLTSSVSGEGKTYCSVNLATVFALSEKKTIVVGLDLRRPKIYGDFNLNNEAGTVNYLIGQKSLEEIIQKTHIPYLDVIVSGPIPPNPSELIMGEYMASLIEELQKEYEYIILDTPPVGLVSDAMEISEYCDVVLYLVRQSITKKSMLSIVNEKYKKGELPNLSLLLNGFESKAKYGYGYSEYKYSSYEYYDDEYRPKTWRQRLKNIFRK